MCVAHQVFFAKWLDHQMLFCKVSSPPSVILQSVWTTNCYFAKCLDHQLVVCMMSRPPALFYLKICEIRYRQKHLHVNIDVYILIYIYTFVLVYPFTFLRLNKVNLTHLPKGCSLISVVTFTNIDQNNCDTTAPLSCLWLSVVCRTA